MTAGFPLSPDILVQLGTLGPAQLAWLSGYCWSQSAHVQAHAGAQAFAGASGWPGLSNYPGQPAWAGFSSHPGLPAWQAAQAGAAAQQAAPWQTPWQAQSPGHAWAQAQLQAQLQGQASAAAAQQAWAQLQAQALYNAQTHAQTCAPGANPYAGAPQTGAAQPGIFPFTSAQGPVAAAGAQPTGAHPTSARPTHAQPAAPQSGNTPVPTAADAGAAAGTQPASTPTASTQPASPQPAGAQSAAAQPGNTPAPTATDTGAATGAPRRITILSASQTGNARRVAQQLHDRLKAEGLSPRLSGVGDYKSKTLPDEDIVVLVTSTQGEGEPPEEAVPLHKFLFGKKSPKLDGLHFAVLGLGDSSYPKFCQAGRDFDAQLEKLGAQRLHERTDCDLDFQATATAWIDSVTQKLQKTAATESAGAGTGAAIASSHQTAPSSGATTGASAASATTASQTNTGNQPALGTPANTNPQTAQGTPEHTAAQHPAAPSTAPATPSAPAMPAPPATAHPQNPGTAGAPSAPRFAPLPEGYPFPGFPFTIVGSPASLPSGFSAGATAGATGLLHALGQGIPGPGLLPGAGGVPWQSPFLDPAVASGALQQAAAQQAASLQALALQAATPFPGQVPGGLMPQGAPGYPGSLPGNLPGGIPGAMPGAMPGSIPGTMFNPETNPVTSPLASPIPGQFPGQFPGQLPGQFPAEFPSQFPGAFPNAFPGTQPGQEGYGGYTQPAFQGDVAVQADPLAAPYADTALAEVQAAPAVDTPTESSTWTRTTPFTATLSARQKITARKAEKDVQHIEIDLEGSGIQYQPGDALGVWPVNAPALVSEILSLHQLKGDETVKLADGTESTLRDALTHHADITQNTPTLVEQYAALSKLRPLQELVENREALDALLATTPPVGLFAEYPHPLPAQQLYSLFRPQAPRLYSIASAQDDVGEAVHLTVGVVHFQHHGQHYMGAASGYLGHLLEEDDEVRVFVEPNRHFRLPEDDDTPIIMIGAGTGVAPFRAFMQQREANGAGGKNWLIFGNQRFTDDFLYQAEWLQHRKSGLLTRADLAWSRQGEQKVYVQHKLLEAGADVWQWLQEGAHIYVCGDASRMARDVENALLDIIRTHGGLDEDDADDYLNTLREDRRYQRDVY